MLTMYGEVPRCVGHVWLGSIGVLNLSFEVLFVPKCLPIYIIICVDVKCKGCFI